MSDAAVPPAPPSSTTGDSEASAPAAGGAWAGVLVVAYASLVSVVNGLLLAVVLPIRSALAYTALDIERRAYDQGGVEGVVEVGNVVRGAWAAVETPLLYTGLVGTLLAVAVLALGLGVVAGREWARVAARAALVVRVAHEAAATAWVGLAVLPDLGEQTNAVFDALRGAAEESGQVGAIGDPPGLLTGAVLPWATAIGAGLHVLLLIWLYRMLGRPRVRAWCARRSRNRKGATASADAPSRSDG